MQAEGINYRIEVDQSLEVMFESDDHGLDIYHQEDNKIYFRQKGKNFLAEIIKMDPYNKTMTIRLDGEYFDLCISDRVDLMIEEMGLDLDASPNIKKVIAPMPGQVLEVLVKPNQKVEEGEGLLVLVAMKMENLIKSPISGVVSDIQVKAEDVVDKGQVLIEFE